MAKIAAFVLALMLAAVPALAEVTVERQTGERFYPAGENWTYHFTYAYPHVLGEDYAAAAINDTYQMALDEMTQLVLPMFANEESMRFDGKNEVIHDFAVMCNQRELLSVMLYRRQTKGQEGVSLSMEALTFDLTGDYVGQSLTLRGVTLAQAGVPTDQLEDVRAEDYPALQKLIDGSSDEMADVLLDVLYPRFQELKQAGVVRADADQDAFEMAFSPAADFYADEEGRVVFFLPPALLAQPTFDVPLFPFTPEELEALL